MVRTALFDFIAINSYLKKSARNKNIARSVMDVLTLMSCHSNSGLKVAAILHNLTFLFEISATVVLINSHEFAGLLEPKIRRAFPQLILNDELSDELCYAYKMNHADLNPFSNDVLKQHWKQYGRNEKRTLGVPTLNLYFEYAANDKFIAHGKWAHYLKKTSWDPYSRFILTNDSFVITRSLRDFKQLMDPAVEMVALLDSHETEFHYPDFLRAYNKSGLTALLDFFEREKERITDIQSVIDVYEIGSSHLFQSVQVLFQSPQGEINIHFHDLFVADYLFTKNYPAVKIKKIDFCYYTSHEVPADFNGNEYKGLHADLAHLDEAGARTHFVRHGLSENRKYKKNQMQKHEALQTYLALVGFNSE